MNKTKIDWCDYTINPVKGLCPMACHYCYARAMYKRFKWNPEIRYQDPFWQFYELKKKPPSRIFIGSTIELFGEWIRPEWIHNILGFCSAYPQHTFLFLTKQPQNLAKFSPFPNNCYVGVTACNDSMYEKAMYYLGQINAKVKYISFEPLLTPIDCRKPWDRRMERTINWLISGTQTRPTVYPRIEWVSEIVKAADKAGVPVFLKNNLKPLLATKEALGEKYVPLPLGDEHGKLRQETPK